MMIINQLNQSVIVKAFIFGFMMLAGLHLMFIFYTFIANMDVKLLKDNFSYLIF